MDVFKDVPILSEGDDKLELNNYAKSLSEFILSTETPFTISIQGEWGSGKTSLMNLIYNNLCSDSSDKRFQGVHIDTWEFFLDCPPDQAVKNVLLTILDEIIKNASNKKLKLENEIKDLALAVSKFFSISIDIVADYFGLDLAYLKEENLKYNSQDNSSLMMVKNIRNKISKIVSKLVQTKKDNTIKGLIFFIDDLDRVDPETAIRLLEIFKNLFNIPHCIFILAIDYDIIVSGLRKKLDGYVFNNDIVFRSYFDKLIQLSFAMPVQTYRVDDLFIDSLVSIEYIASRDVLNEKQNEDLEKVILYTMSNNPRQVKRLVNSVHFSFIYDNNNHCILKNTALKLINIILLAIQQAYPNIYSYLTFFSNFLEWDNEMFPYIEVPENYEQKELWKKILQHMCEINEATKRAYPSVLYLFSLILKYSHRDLDILQSLLSLSALINVKPTENKILYNGLLYDNHSGTQYKQGNYLIKLVDPIDNSNILDVGCGNGKTTIELALKCQNSVIDAIDVSPSQIEIAIQNYNNNTTTHKAIINFEVRDILTLKDIDKYDIIFSNSVLHWFTDPELVYKILFAALKPNGTLYVHQGGVGSYKGLHAMAKQAYINLSLDRYFKNWQYPIFYPTREQLHKLVKKVGFTNISIFEDENDGKDNVELYKDFMVASLNPYLERMPISFHENFKSEYLDLCKENLDTLNLYTHRLYLVAQK